MSPIPPNQQQNGKGINDRDANLLNNLPLAAQTPINEDDNDDGSDGNNSVNNENYDQYGQVAYQQLNTDPLNNQQQNSEDSDNDNGFDDFQQLAESRSFNRTNQNSNIIPNLTENSDEDAFKRVECENISLDSSKLDAINNIMSNIKLPTNCTPGWATVIPEEQWKQNLIENLNAKQTNLFEINKEEK